MVVQSHAKDEVDKIGPDLLQRLMTMVNYQIFVKCALVQRLGLLLLTSTDWLSWISQVYVCDSCAHTSVRAICSFISRPVVRKQSWMNTQSYYSHSIMTLVALFEWLDITGVYDCNYSCQQ